MKGKRLPQIRRIEIAIVEETNPRSSCSTRGSSTCSTCRDVAPNMIDSKGNLLPNTPRAASGSSARPSLP